jgi:hypothetical protein
MKYFLILIFIFVTSNFAEQKSEITGKITYKSKNFYYVAFDQTNYINYGDTLYIHDNNKFVSSMVVKHISNRSVACIPLLANLNLGENVIAFVSNSINVYRKEKDKIINDYAIEKLLTNKTEEPVKTISGRIGVTSYSSFDNFSKNNFVQRFRYYLSANEKNISGAPVNFNSNIIFTYRTTEWYKVNKNLGNALKVYDLNINYNFDNNSLWFGRRINPKISNIGTIDGIQFETKLDKYSFGAVIGSRPNFVDYGFNLKLFQFGAYAVRTDTINNKTILNSISVFNQTNNYKTDRRFIYFQHANNILKNLSFFVSGEWDLYKIVRGIKKNDLFFTSFYSSVNYNSSGLFSFNLSYDARKNIIYYETFKTYADSIFENELRQGFRIRTNFRFLNSFFVSLNYGYRFKNGDNKTNNNYGVNLSYYNIPIIKSSINLTYNKILSSYLDGSIYGASLGKDLFNGILNTNLSYRYVAYNFVKYGGNINQNIAGIDLSLNLFRSFYSSFSYEGVFEKNRTYGYININIGKRF